MNSYLKFSQISPIDQLMLWHVCNQLLLYLYCLPMKRKNDNPSPGVGHEWGKKFLALTSEVNLHNQPIIQKLRSEIHAHSSP